MSRVDGIIAKVQLSLLHVHAQNACKQVAYVAVGQNEGAFVYNEGKDSGTNYCPNVVGFLQMATKGIPDENLLLQYPFEHDCQKHLRDILWLNAQAQARQVACLVTRFRRQRCGSDARVCTERNAETILRNDETPVWGPNSLGLGPCCMIMRLTSQALQH